MKVSKDTRISQIIKENIAAIDAIASINPHFKKLQNPILRKVLAPRVSIADAARIGKVSPEDFFKTLEALGFEIDRGNSEIDMAEVSSNPKSHEEDKAKFHEHTNLESLDVRPILESGKDPFSAIMEKVKLLKSGMVLEIVNSFEPTPLINILKKQGYEIRVEDLGKLIKTYVKKSGEIKVIDKKDSKIYQISSQELELKRMDWLGKTVEVDVRDMEMPLPMVTILAECEQLAKDAAIYVHHKKVPQYLLPELEDRNFTVWIAEWDAHNVKLLIHY